MPGEPGGIPFVFTPGAAPAAILNHGSPTTDSEPARAFKSCQNGSLMVEAERLMPIGPRDGGPWSTVANRSIAITFHAPNPGNCLGALSNELEVRISSRHARAAVPFLKTEVTVPSHRMFEKRHFRNSRHRTRPRDSPTSQDVHRVIRLASKRQALQSMLLR